MNKLRAVILVCVGDTEAAINAITTYLAKRPDWTTSREVEANAANWVADPPRDRWLEALADAGLPD